ncbi:MAG: hypothetical protein ACLFR8_11805 [Alkalispirochaeta sp.]
MSIQPIDLQTLFVRLSQIGREQSAIKQAIAQNQAVTGSEIAQRSKDVGHTVRESSEVSEGPETVQEDESNQTGTGESPGQRPDQREKEPDSETEFTDPDLGQNIDLTG